MAKQNVNTENNCAHPVYGRDELAKVQNQVNRQSGANQQRHEEGLAKLDRAFERQADTPTTS